MHFEIVLDTFSNLESCPSAPLLHSVRLSVRLATRFQNSHLDRFKFQRKSPLHCHICLWRLDEQVQDSNTHARHVLESNRLTPKIRHCSQSQFWSRC